MKLLENLKVNVTKNNPIKRKYHNVSRYVMKNEVSASKNPGSIVLFTGAYISNSCVERLCSVNFFAI